MLNKAIRVLNFDNSITSQSGLFLEYQARVVDFTDLAASTRLFMSGLVREKIAARLSFQERNYPTFIGSGDFHHISEVLTAQIDQPASLFVFDFHPDWDSLPPRFGCGSWVAQALKNKNISKCILIGAGSDDLSGLALQSASLGALASGRLEIYPFKHKPSRVYFRSVPANESVIARRSFLSSRILWHELENENLTEFMLGLIKRLPGQKVYISIDKDCLKSDFALTNWEEGHLSLNQLLSMLKPLRDNLDIIGLDITGDYSYPLISNSLKAALSRLDHPKRVAADNCPKDLILKVNEQVNLRILQEMLA
jgi:arginase family enzyme